MGGMLCVENDLMINGTKRIAIVYPQPFLDTVHSLCNAAEILADEGYLVEIFATSSSEFVPLKFQNANIIIRPAFSPPRRERSGVHRIIPGNWLLALSIRQYHQKIPYQAFIGVDPQGLIQASHITQFIRVPLVYFSLELLLRQEIGKSGYAKIKKEEVRLSRKAAFVIIQDEERAQLLASDNSIPIDRFVYVPNSPLGPARRQKTDYWYNKFGFPSEKKVALHTGSISEWTGIDGIIESVKDWPDNYVLVIHSRYDARSSERITALESMAMPGKVFFSPEPVSRFVYDQLVDSADIGIAFYQNIPGDVYTQQNLTTIGLSSGKVTYALRSGLPVIISRGSGLPELIGKYHCGIVVDDYNEIGAALTKIDRAYKEYSESAMDFFNSHLDYSVGFQTVLSYLNSL
jgi:glycosyltransferase involved in cell wall biosynthesis